LIGFVALTPLVPADQERNPCQILLQVHMSANGMARPRSATYLLNRGREVTPHCHAGYSALVCCVTHRASRPVRSDTFRLVFSHMNRRIACLTALFATLTPRSVFAREGQVTVYAAASMKNALDDINAAFTKSTDIKVNASYAGSQTLVHLIEKGAPVDVFISADIDWMDYGIQKKVIKDDSCIYLLGNTLVLIASKDSKLGNVKISPGFNLAQLAGDGLIATGDVQAVPVGIYAKEALEKLGSWDAAAAKFIMTQNVREALARVVYGDASLGIVYATDAKVEPRVKIIGTFPVGSHRAIVYPAAATVTAKPEADTYLSYLHSEAAKAVFDKYGFSFLIRPLACR
jgi:molybdate transport system substrate-binding protein